MKGKILKFPGKKTGSRKPKKSRSARELTEAEYEERCRQNDRAERDSGMWWRRDNMQLRRLFDRQPGQPHTFYDDLFDDASTMSAEDV